MTSRVIMLAAVVAVTLVLFGASTLSAKPKPKKPDHSGQTTPATKVTALDFKMKDIDGKDVDLAQYRGKVVLMVNVASKCGFTPQYKDLEELYKKYSDKGFVILGFPANNFGHQEPGTDPEIKEYCTKTYSVTFPMFAKISVKGKDQAPLYKYLTSKDAGHNFGGDVEWNFTKFLIDTKGNVVGRYKSAVSPASPKLRKAIEANLPAKS